MNYKWDADRLRTRRSNTWRFYLSNEDTDTLDLRDFEINSGTVRGNDREGHRRIKPIQNILFAFPVEKILDVRPHIEKAQPSKSVTKMQLKKGELRQALKKHIVLTMRGGYVIRGKLQKFDDYRLFMRVDNTDVQVYRHGILKFEKETVPNQTKTNDLRQLRKKRHQERVKAGRLKKEPGPNQTEGNDRNETRKKRQPEHVEANRLKKEKVPSQTKTNDLHELRKDREEWVETSRLKKEPGPNQTEGNDRNETRKKRQPEGDEAETMAEIARALRTQGKSPEEILDRISTEKRRAERLTIQLSDAEEKQYEIRARSIRSTRNTIDPHIPLREQYTKFNNMKCQMCRQEMPFKKRNSDDDYFDAVEAFGRDYFPKEHEAQYLALCPVCAAKYQEYVKNDKAAQKVLYNILKDSDEPEVRLELSDFAIHIWFDEKHWHDLKTVLHYYENVYESENSTD